MNKTTAVILTAAIFVLVGALAFAAFAPTLSQVNAARPSCSLEPGACSEEKGERPP